MKKLIKNQDIKFDTHQAGDSQEINEKSLHMEKILHKPKGVKLKFHLFNGTVNPEKQNNNVNRKILEGVKKEVKNTCKKEKQKCEKFIELIVNALNRYLKEGIDETVALEVAGKIASYFDLDNDFIKKVIEYSKEKSIIKVTTEHMDRKEGKKYRIIQKRESISIQSRKKSI